MDECELITLVTAVACALSKCCSTEDITILAPVFSQLGDTLATILVQREINEDRINNNSENDIECNPTNPNNSSDVEPYQASNIPSDVEPYPESNIPL